MPMTEFAGLAMVLRFSKAKTVPSAEGLRNFRAAWRRYPIQAATEPQ